LTQGGNPSVLNPPAKAKARAKAIANPAKPIAKPATPLKKMMMGTPPTKKGLRYNPYGSGTANPSNMSSTTGP